MYLVGDPASEVFDGELREGHLWLDVQRAVAMVIVTLLEERVVGCLTTKQLHGESAVLRVGGAWSPSPAHLWEAALVVQNPQDPVRLCGDEVNAGLVVDEGDVLPGDLLPVVLLLLQPQQDPCFSC